MHHFLCIILTKIYYKQKTRLEKKRVSNQFIKWFTSFWLEKTTVTQFLMLWTDVNDDLVSIGLSSLFWIESEENTLITEVKIIYLTLFSLSYCEVSNPIFSVIGTDRRRERTRKWTKETTSFDGRRPRRMCRLTVH